MAKKFKSTYLYYDTILILLHDQGSVQDSIDSNQIQFSKPYNPQTFFILLKFLDQEMDRLRAIADAHYRAGSPQVKTLAYDFFKALDTDGDGRVSLAEFLAFMTQQG